LTIDNLAPIVGHCVALRLVTPQDAAYIHSLRTNPVYNAHLSAAAGGVSDQRDWINRYKMREVAGEELYYIIARRTDQHACGAVRIYDITPIHFTWGSWILDQNKPHQAALDSALLVYQIGFEILGLQKSVFDVRNDNAHTLAFHRRFGAKQMGNDDVNTYFEHDRAAFAAQKPYFDRIFEVQV
jgi:RimJ/RimL family protein N-acetyltransferase